jgi:hypothetical protein
MSDATGPHLAPSKVPQINTMTMGDIGYALRMGLRDFRRKPMMGLFFANVAVMGGYLIYVLLFLWQLEWLAIPLTFGFPLIGPFLAVGLYEVSRRLEAGQTEWKRNDILGVIWRQRARQLPLMSWVIIVYYLFWSFFAHMLFALFLGPSVLTNVTSSYAYLLEPEGLRMLLVGRLRRGLCLCPVHADGGVAAASSGQGAGFRHRDADLDRRGAEEPGRHADWGGGDRGDDVPRDVAVSLRACSSSCRCWGMRRGTSTAGR